VTLQRTINPQNLTILIITPPPIRFESKVKTAGAVQNGSQINNHQEQTLLKSNKKTDYKISS